MVTFLLVAVWSRQGHQSLCCGHQFLCCSLLSTWNTVVPSHPKKLPASLCEQKPREPSQQCLTL